VAVLVAGLIATIVNVLLVGQPKAGPSGDEASIPAENGLPPWSNEANEANPIAMPPVPVPPVVEATADVGDGATTGYEGGGQAEIGPREQHDVGDDDTTETATDRTIEPSKQRPKPKPRPSKKRVKTRALEEKLRRACRSSAGFKSYNVTVTVPATGEKKVGVRPLGFPRLTDCIADHAKALPRGNEGYNLHFTMPPLGD
jgi:hypothetical protein